MIDWSLTSDLNHNLYQYLLSHTAVKVRDFKPTAQ